jgi:Tfp pilus assembly protein PilP
MLLLIQKGTSWIGSLALSCCLVLMMALPVCVAQEGNQTIPAAPDTTAAQDTGSAATVSPGKAASATPPEKGPETEKMIIDKRQKVLNALTKKDFSYAPENMVDPFISFIVAINAPGEPLRPREEEEEAGPPTPKMPLTPLQKMAVGQIERGFKAVIWGDMGMRAMIEDDAPLGGNNGIITDIQNDRLVIQQELWDPNIKQMVPRSVEIKLTKAGDKK